MRPPLFPLAGVALLIGVGFAAQDTFAETGPLLLLLAAIAVALFMTRRALAELMRRMSALPILAPWWMVRRPIPMAVRKFAAYAVPVAVSLFLTPVLSGVFNGFGFAIFVVTLSTCTMLAYLLLAEAPR